MVTTPTSKVLYGDDAINGKYRKQQIKEEEKKKILEAGQKEKAKIYANNPEYRGEIDTLTSQAAFFGTVKKPTNILKFYRTSNVVLDGIQQKLGIPIKVYLPDRNKFPNFKSIVIGVHGVCMHSKSLHHLADQLTAEGHLVVCPDLPGQGKNNQYYDPGIKNPMGHVDSYTEWTDAVHELYKALEQEPAFYGTKIDLLGHSMGGLVVATAVQKHNIGNNVILSVPGFSAVGGVRPFEALSFLPNNIRDLYLPGLEGLFGIGEPGGLSFQYIGKTVSAIIKDKILSQVPLIDSKTYVNVPKPVQREDLAAYNKLLESDPNLRKEFRPLRELTELTSSFLGELGKLSFAAKRAVRSMPEDKNILFVIAPNDRVVDWKTIARMSLECGSKKVHRLILEDAPHDYIWYNVGIEKVVGWLSKQHENSSE